MVCTVLKKPQPDWFTVTVSFQSHSDDAILASARTKEVRCNYGNIDDWGKTTTNMYQTGRKTTD